VLERFLNLEVSESEIWSKIKKMRGPARTILETQDFFVATLDRKLSEESGPHSVAVTVRGIVRKGRG
jgi:hypothetical protein